MDFVTKRTELEHLAKAEVENLKIGKNLHDKEELKNQSVLGYIGIDLSESKQFLPPSEVSRPNFAI